jgi:hypothetical protein
MLGAELPEPRGARAGAGLGPEAHRL